MSVIGRELIKKRLELPPDDVRALVITPLVRDSKGEISGLDYDSIDLRLGSRFLLPRAYDPKTKSDVRANRDAHELVQPIHVAAGQELLVPSHGTVLGVTLEFIKLPFDMSGQVLTRSSLARDFITIETAPWIHPLYRGCLTLEIANASGIPFPIKPGKAIAQLILFRLLSGERPGQDHIDRYMGPTFPEP